MSARGENTSSSPTKMATPFSSTRLYVGNLAASCDEFTLMKLCAQHGKIAKLDYLFHKSGPAKGKPRGYAFVEYSTKDVRPAVSGRAWRASELTPFPLARSCVCLARFRVRKLGRPW